MSSAQYKRDLEDTARELGYTIGRTGGGQHLKITHPRVKSPIFASATPSDHRALKNIVSKMKRMLRNPQENGHA